MKKLLFLLLLLPIIVFGQCGGDVTVWSPGINLHTDNGVGVNVSLGHLARESKVSFLVSSSAHRGKTMEIQTIDNKQVEVQRSYMLLALSANVSYKVIHIDYKYSLDAVVGALFSDNGLYPQLGARFIVPLINKALYIEPLYQFKNGTSIITGVFFEL